MVQSGTSPREFVNADLKAATTPWTQTCSPGGVVYSYVKGQPGTTVRFVHERVPNSGGHFHPGGPVSTSNPPEVVLAGAYPQNVKVAHSAPQFGGIIKLTDRFSNGTVQVNYIHVMVPGLVGLATDPSITFIGSRPEHPSNHFGTPKMVARLTKLAKVFHKKFSKPLEINDMSLPDGGVFDHRANWAPPHETHGEGLTVDVRKRSMSAAEQNWFKITAAGLGFRVEIHDPGTQNEHWHLRFTSVRLFARAQYLVMQLFR